jgi:hypothetical protein
VRLSLLPDSPHYDIRRAPRAKVFVGDKEIPYCVEASEEDGYAIVTVKGRDGRSIVVDVGRGKEILRARIEGPIRIELADW